MVVASGNHGCSGMFSCGDGHFDIQPGDIRSNSGRDLPPADQFPGLFQVLGADGGKDLKSLCRFPGHGAQGCGQGDARFGFGVWDAHPHGGFVDIGVGLHDNGLGIAGLQKRGGHGGGQTDGGGFGAAKPGSVSRRRSCQALSCRMSLRLKPILAPWNWWGAESIHSGSPSPETRPGRLCTPRTRETTTCCRSSALKEMTHAKGLKQTSPEV
jgi:hypothetical protein